LKELIFVIFLLLTLILLLTPSHFTLVKVSAIGNPDTYGNAIVWLTVEQWDGVSWDVLLNHSTAINWTVRVEDDTPTRFQVKWRLNNTLANSIAQAVEYTRVLMNITGIWTNKELTNVASSSDPNFYYGVERGVWNQTGYPQAGMTYDVTTRYEAYY